MSGREGTAAVCSRAVVATLVALVLAAVADLRLPAEPAQAALPLGFTGTGPAQALPPWTTGRVLVRFEPGASPRQRVDVRALVSALSAKSLPLPGLEVLEIAPAVSVPVAVALLERSPVVAYAEPDYTRAATFALDDPYLPSLWGYDSPRAGIDAPRAWDLGGGAGAPVAVVDSGLDLEHPDLAPNVWRNPGESGQGRESNHVDDDGNGFVDDWRGWDWVDDDNEPADRNGHGTHVSGTIAAQGNDRRGIAGIAWDGAVLSLRVLNENAVGSVSGLVSAYAYAREQRIPIVNASVEEAHYSRSEYEAMAYAPETLFVVAAGNDSSDVDRARTFPCDYDLDNVICVAAIGRDGALADFSNYGAHSVDLAAPGAGILSTWVGGGWRSWSGTSMAAPHVAGVGALVSALSDVSGSRLKQLLVSTARPAPSLRGKVASGARLDAYRAIRRVDPPGRAAGRGLRLRMRVPPRQGLAGALRRGVRLRSACSHACRLRVVLTLGKRARGASGRSWRRQWIDAGRGRATFGRAGQRALAVRVRSSVKRKLRRMRTAHLAVRAVAVDDGRGRKVLIRHVTLVRG
jgi:subtilisin family serine protease